MGEKVDNLQRLMRDHFYYEEAQFCDALDLPWDYCKEHKKKHVKFSERFAKLVAPVDMAEIKWAQNWLAPHIKNTDFGFEEQRFCSVPSFNCVNHLIKHYKFWVVLEDEKAPINCEEINWAKNWLAQHIKIRIINTRRG